MNPIKTTKRALRRFLLETQLLLPDSQSRAGLSTSGASSPRQVVMDVIRHLECVQLDPVNAVRPNQHLVLAARIEKYDPGILGELLRTGAIFEYLANAACLIPMEDYPMFEPTRQRLRAKLQHQLDTHAPIIEQVLQKLSAEGPLPSKAFDSELRVHGYWDNVQAKTKATSHALNLLLDAAQIAIVGREGNQRLFDVRERVVPAELLQQSEQIDPHEASEALLEKYFRAYRVFEPSDPRLGWQRLSASERREAIDRRLRSGQVVTVEVEGLTKPYYILGADAKRLGFYAEEEQAGLAHADQDQVRFLPPLDNLLWSRKRLEDLFSYSYRWEIYTPAHKRKYGYYAMPILLGDRLIGRMDPRLDAKKKHLTVELLQIEPQVKFTKTLEKRLRKAVDAFARTHGAKTVSIENIWVES
ncbi:winged helix DNA-binding domain-containing protein [Brevibacillus ruminantium]|uniref:Winged helix DNA-binding domain-containing protein n=1 Tax=Brevibacillus ruminantium TaxID=2950604 RepID=A0ABY4WKP5_9BACL|nr:crosslink repair DNA glycosylase YcaQ family protein [Brevibacillus ruminantium]USG66632.1 winged helix DNA-binding domain-containing protein [Brevibacillus ruminantium]